MTMKIEVTIPENEVSAGCAAHYLAQAMSAIGFSRGVSLPMPAPAAPDASQPEADEAVVPGIREAVAQDAAAEAPKRERGKPAPGRARRTKEEIAEDEAADKADAEAAHAATSKARIEATENVANISTGEERIDPTAPEDAAQDAADEAAEVEATKAPELSHDDVRAAITAYTSKYGVAAVMADFMDGIGLKVESIKQDQLAKVIAFITDMTERDGFLRGREAVKDDVTAALMDYALVFDGQNTVKTLEAMPVTMADGPAILASLFGAGVQSASLIPASPDNYAKAARAIRYALVTNPYKREARL